MVARELQLLLDALDATAHTSAHTNAHSRAFAFANAPANAGSFARLPSGSIPTAAAALAQCWWRGWLNVGLSRISAAGEQCNSERAAERWGKLLRPVPARPLWRRLTVELRALSTGSLFTNLCHRQGRVHTL